MKRFYALMGTLLLTGCIIFISCKKEDTEPTPVDKTPVLTFMTGTDYVSSDITLEVNTAFKVGVLGSKNPNTNIDLATFKVEKTFDGMTIVYETEAVDGSNLSWESSPSTQSAIGQETWTFTVTDYTGFKKEISLVITTVEAGSLSPAISFIEGVNYTFEDVTLPPNTELMIGVNAYSNAGTNIDLATFKVERTFNGMTVIVHENNAVDGPSLTWESNQSAQALLGPETWTFTITDKSGMASEISFVITTFQTVYIPSFSPTYLVVNQGGVEMLDFYLTCTTDDWEMIKVIVTYPGGLGSETYVGSGQIITAGSPFTFSNYFPKLAGTWSFSILGTIKSGAHVGESFTATTTVSVSAPAYIPIFSVTAIPYTVGNTEYLSFVTTCTSDDYELILIIIEAPGGLGSTTYDGNGVIVLKEEPITLTTDYENFPGTWTLTIRGIIKSGVHAGESFEAIATVITS